MKAKLLNTIGYSVNYRVGDILGVEYIDGDGRGWVVCDKEGKSESLPFSPSDYELISDTNRNELIQEMQAQFVKIDALLSDLESKLNLLAKVE